MTDIPEKPITSAEAYLSVIAGLGGELPAAPITRNETWLAAIAGQNVVLPEGGPITHTEAYLDYILKHGIVGSGGSGDYTLQFKEATPTKAAQSVMADSGYYGLSRVTVKAIPDIYQDVSGVTATEGDVLSGASFVAPDGTLINGTIKDNGAISETMDGLVIDSVSIPGGYTSGGFVSLSDSIENALKEV